MEIRSDFLVIGSGIAGLSFALKAARAGTVAVVTKRAVRESATYYAQGGIASVLSAEDSFEDHIRDTIAAGAGLCDRSVVEMVVRDGPARIRELMELGARFTNRRVDGHLELDLGKEGGHSKRRIVHAGDITGREVEDALIKAVEAEKRIAVYEQHMAVDLITHTKFVSRDGPERVWGAYVLDGATGRVETMLAPTTVLATGGGGKVYIYTSNPDVASGDGIAMAYRAGAEVANMEFIQFHPTCLYHPEAKSFLISEALRGEGAVLRLRDGSTFMDRYHEMAELAPRDIVARAIDFELKKRGDEYVLLDISHRPAAFIKKRFPNIYRKCLEFGFDLTAGPVPVVPAAHYICGGARTDTNGKTTIEGLYAIGETACTGLHGANRLASNSLLEALVFANRAAAHATSRGRDRPPLPSVPPWEPGEAVPSDEAVVITHNWDEIRRFMWNYVGIVRSDKRLERAHRRIRLLQREINEYYWDFTVTGDLLELRNIATVAELIIRCAMTRKESRGLHYNIDYPRRDDERFLRDTVIRRE
ncbi:MAG TPA: L-aspartate oxidase [Deltaproteobacteria bacterium]|nr:L-aspartate oxidase [Deltaproteobacteria bacterium]